MLNHWNIHQAARIVREGGVIAYPTEAVWGLGCDPWNEAAVMRLLALKRRPVQKGLILVASDVDQIEPLLYGLTSTQRAAVIDSWPGPNTWLLPDEENLIPAWVKGKFSSVAVRVSAHPVVKGLCEAAKMPLVSTSANPAGSTPARTKLRVSAYFGSNLNFRVQGALGDSSRPSLIRDALTQTVIRD